MSASSSTSRKAVLTVGSTRFDPLVAATLSSPSLAALASLGVSDLLAQVGNSALPSGWAVGSSEHTSGLQVEVVRFLDDLEGKVGRADVVVSHAGAGSILSFLRPLHTSDAPSKSPRPRQLVLVPNSTLMDSHQSDLADAMEKKGWATICRHPSDLPKTLEGLMAQAGEKGEIAQPKYPELDKARVQRILDETLGFA